MSEKQDVDLVHREAGFAGLYQNCVVPGVGTSHLVRKALN